MYVPTRGRPPTLDDALSADRRRATVVVPMLLADAYHARVDMAPQVRRSIAAKIPTRPRALTVDGATHRHVSYDIPRDTAATGSAKRAVAPPAPKRDQQIYSTSKQAYLPFTSPGFERG
jgi:sirohydrochlorin ferrochelatase